MATVRPAEDEGHPDDHKLITADPEVWLSAPELARLEDDDAQAYADARRTAAIEAYARCHGLPANDLFRELGAERRHITDRATVLRVLGRSPGWIAPLSEAKKARMLRAQGGQSC